MPEPAPSPATLTRGVVPVLARVVLHLAAAALPLAALALVPLLHGPDNSGLLSSFPIMGVSLAAAQLAALWGWFAIRSSRSMGAALWWGVVMGVMTHYLAGILLGIVQLFGSRDAAGGVFALVGAMVLYILSSLFLVGWLTVPAAAAVASMVYRLQRPAPAKGAC